MSVKHVKDYYEQVAQQYQDMLTEIKDFEDLAMNEMFDPERLEQIKESIQPMLRNYETLSYIMYLLNKPNRDSKASKYEKQYAKKISALHPSTTKDGVIATNNSVLNNLKNKA
jgi:hypothetical protein